MKKFVNSRCTICGELMENVSPNKKYCTCCKEIVKWRANDERKAQKRKMEVSEREETGILAVVRKADALGLSYGEYVSRYEQ